MAPALKLKRMKKAAKPKSSAVAPSKPKWQKPKKSISAQPGVTKIKKIKRSYDPIKANRGVVLLKNIPHGFYEDEMRKYFGQFGMVTRVRLARSQRTGRSKGFAYIEFKVCEVAQIAAETMNNYMMFKHILKAVYIPPDKQTHNFFRKDVAMTTDSNGQTTFTSAKIKNIENEIANINRVPTDEEHAKRLKRTEKTLQKQQKKYGIDLSNIMVSGSASSSTTDASSPEVKTDAKKKVKPAKKVVESKVEAKRSESKVVAKKDKKKAAAEKEVVTSNSGKSLLQGLLDETYETDTSDDDFKIDHSFNGSVDVDSDDNAPSLVDLLAKKLSKNKKSSGSSSFMETSDDLGSDEDDGDESDDDSDLDDDDVATDDLDSDDDIVLDEEDDDDDLQLDDESGSDDDEEPEPVPQKQDKKLNRNVKGPSTNGTSISAIAKAGVKRKLKEVVSDPPASSSQLQLDTGAKKKKLNQPKKTVAPIASKVEAPKAIAGENKKQKKLAPTVSSSKPETVPLPTKQNKTKASAPATSSTTTKSAPKATTPPKPVNGNQKNKKNKPASNGKSPLSSSTAETSASEPESSKQKNKNKQSKPTASGASKPQSVDPKVETAPTVNLKLSKKKNQPTKDEETNSKSKKLSPAPTSGTEVVGSKKNKKEKITAAVTQPPQVATVDKRKNKLKPVKSSLINTNGLTKKVKKLKANAEKSLPSTTDGAWTTVSETDGDEVKKPKATGSADLRSIVHKKKKLTAGSAKSLDTKKIKQTPDDLLQLMTTNELKQNKQLKSKKKSK